MPEEENQAQFGFMSQVDFLMFMGARVEKRSHVLKLIVNNSLDRNPTPQWSSKKEFRV